MDQALHHSAEHATTIHSGPPARLSQPTHHRQAASPQRRTLTLKLPMTTIVAQPFNVIKWQLKFNPVA